MLRGPRGSQKGNISFYIRLHQKRFVTQMVFSNFLSPISTKLQHVIPVGVALTAYNESKMVPDWLTIAAAAEVSAAYFKA